MDIFLTALVIAAILTLFFSFGLQREREVAGILWFFILVFLPIWALSIWIPPYGPVFWGAFWVVPLLAGITIVGLLAASGPKKFFTKRPGPQRGDVTAVSEKDVEWSVGANLMVFMFFIILVVSILVGQIAKYD